MTLSKELKTGTKKSHSAAENTKFVASFLRGVVDPEEYRKLIANFYFVYRAMEEEISKNPIVAVIDGPVLYRTNSLERDLRYYYGPTWRSIVSPTPACQEYVNRIRDVDKLLLIGHHYTRYIGDLSGGKILKEITARVLKPPAGKGLDFYEFPSIPNAKLFKQNYRAVLDNLGTDSSQENALITEANYAFRLNMYMFDEIQGNASKSFLKLALSYLQSFVSEMTVSKRFR